MKSMPINSTRIPEVVWQPRTHSNRDNGIFGSFETPISWKLYELSGIEDLEIYLAKEKK